MSKKYKFLLLIVLLMPQIHYFPHLFTNNESNVLVFLIWLLLFAIIFFLSGSLLVLMINRHKQFYSKTTIVSARLFSLVFLAALLGFILSFFSEGALTFMAYFLPYYGVLIVLLYILMYYIVVAFTVRDMKNMTKTKSMSLFEKFGLFIPFISFGFSAFSGYFTESLFGGGVFLEQELANIDILSLISLIFIILSLANPITILKVGSTWIKDPRLPPQR